MTSEGAQAYLCMERITINHTPPPPPITVLRASRTGGDCQTQQSCVHHGLLHCPSSFLPSRLQQWRSLLMPLSYPPTCWLDSQAWRLCPRSSTSQWCAPPPSSSVSATSVSLSEVPGNPFRSPVLWAALPSLPLCPLGRHTVPCLIAQHLPAGSGYPECH